MLLALFEHIDLTFASSEGQGIMAGHRCLKDVWDGTSTSCNVCLASKWRHKFSHRKDVPEAAKTRSWNASP